MPNDLGGMDGEVSRTMDLLATERLILRDGRMLSNDFALFLVPLIPRRSCAI